MFDLAAGSGSDMRKILTIFDKEKVQGVQMSPGASATGPPGQPASGPVPAFPHPRRWWILIALCLSLMVMGVDTTVLSVALPVLTQALGASTTDLQWIADSYV